MQKPLLSPADSLTNQAEQVSSPSVGATSHKRTAVSRTSLAAYAAFGLSRPSLNPRPLRLALPGGSSRTRCHVVHSTVDAMTARGQSVVLLGTSAVAGRMNASVFGVGALGRVGTTLRSHPCYRRYRHRRLSRRSRRCGCSRSPLPPSTALALLAGTTRPLRPRPAPSSPVCRTVRGPVARASLARCAWPVHSLKGHFGG